MTHPTDDLLREALEKLHHAVCGETGFAAAVRQESGKAYPWPALDIADELARAALAAAPQPAPVGDWRNDPSADERWNAGCDYAMTALCKLLCIDTDDVTWDAATEELEGDVLAVLSNILTVRFGDDWRKDAPQPAPEDREALVEVILKAMLGLAPGRSMSNAIADALLARGLRLPGEETMAWAAKVILTQPKRPGSLVADAFTSACAYLEDRECGAETTNEIIETFLNALAGEDN